MLIERDEIGNSYISNTTLEKDVYRYLNDGYKNIDLIYIKIKDINILELGLTTNTKMNIKYLENLQKSILMFLSQRYNVSIFRINIKLYAV